MAITYQYNEVLLLALSPNSTYSICRGFVVQQVVQQIHDKSNKWSLGIMVRDIKTIVHMLPFLDLLSHGLPQLDIWE